MSTGEKLPAAGQQTPPKEGAGQAGLLGLISLRRRLLAMLSSHACQAKAGAEIQLRLMFAARVAVARQMPNVLWPQCSPGHTA